MDWLAVRAWMVTGLDVGVGVAADPAAPMAGWAWPSGVPTAMLVGAVDGFAFPTVFVCAFELNSVLLAGTSSRNDAKILLSSGCVHTTFATSPGTTSPRGKFGSVKKAILLFGL